MIFFSSIILFVTYYLASFNTLKIGQKTFFIFLYILIAVVNRLLIAPELNKDYFGYFDLHNFDDPEDFLSFLFSEPYLYLVYKFFSFFNSDKKIIFDLIYWFNLLLTNLFYVWLLTRADVSVWKKVALFTLYYFLFGFVLLRNAPVYMIFGCFFYYSFRGKIFYKMLLTPLMHLSALPLIITIFNRNKYYFKGLFFILLVMLPFILFYILPLSKDLISLQNTSSKIEAYSDEILNVSIFHKLFFVFVSFALISTIFFYGKKAMNPIFVTTAISYYIFFFINPVLGFRYSPYVFLALLLFDFKNQYSSKWVKLIDLASILLLPYFISTLIDTHHL